MGNVTHFQPEARQLTREQWAIAREEWQSRRVKTKVELAMKWRVSPAAVRMRAKREGWKRYLEVLRDFAGVAQARAKTRDSFFEPNVTPPATPDHTQGGASEAAPAGERARLLRQMRTRHLEELNLPRAMLRTAIELPPAGEIIKVDARLIRSARVAAQVLAIVHAGERTALGVRKGEPVEEAGGGYSVKVMMINSTGQWEEFGKARGSDRGQGVAPQALTASTA